MINFGKKNKSTSELKIDPFEIYHALDRASDKGPLRRVQETILKNWTENYRNKKDVILKLNTGQGKTILGLVILQSKLNETKEPSLYLCPNNFLVRQTASQADNFGVKYALSDGNLPNEFLDGKKILICTAQKLFNGLTKFKLNNDSIAVSNIVLDDAHACINDINDSFRFKIKRGDSGFAELVSLFQEDLKEQRAGSLMDIVNGDSQVFLAVPYWNWQKKIDKVIKILSSISETDSVKFAWKLLRDKLNDCRCIISGSVLEISPFSIPIQDFGSYYRASHRVFMSATINDDSFLIKGLGVEPEAILNPLVDVNEKWSGEKMVLIPSLIDNELTRDKIVEKFAKPDVDRNYGVVALAPSFNQCLDWGRYGSLIAKKEVIEEQIQNLRDKDYKQTIVLVNRYDGIDLPDNMCRILILDSRPYVEALEDRYISNCRFNSDVINLKIAQQIEQGFGRGVRGEKDYCVIIIIGEELVKLVKSKKTAKFFSSQTKSQLNIAEEIIDLSHQQTENSTLILQNLINQVIKRDDDWKEYYVKEMNERASISQSNHKVFSILKAEKKAEDSYKNGNYLQTQEIIQKLIDDFIEDEEEKGWYLQEIARYLYPFAQAESVKFQQVAFNKNKNLFRPLTGVHYAKLNLIGTRRISNIRQWIKKHEDYRDLNITVNSLCESLKFGMFAEQFERDLNEIGKALGFECQRPDFEQNEGPDNLWLIQDNCYMLFECKSEVLDKRQAIVKTETGQMNNSCAWFEKEYGQAQFFPIIIIPTKKLGQGAAFNCEVKVMRENGLSRLANNVRKFYREFERYDLQNLTDDMINNFLNTHELNIKSIQEEYSESPKFMT